MARWIHASVMLAALTGTPAIAAQTAPPDGAHDFDWELGAWSTRPTRRTAAGAGS